jgi:hypothetical protein
MEGYCVALPKHTKKPIPLLGYLIIKYHGSTLLEGYFSCSKLHNTPAIPLIGYPKYTLGSITLNVEGYCRALPKPTCKAILCLEYSINTMG